MAKAPIKKKKTVDFESEDQVKESDITEVEKNADQYVEVLPNKQNKLFKNDMTKHPKFHKFQGER